MKDKKEKRNYSVPNLERGMHIMELLGKNNTAMSMVEIATALEYPNNSVFRITASLTELGYLHRCEKSKRFSLTRKFLTLAYSAVHEYNIVEKSIHAMRTLRDDIRETVLLGTMLTDDAQLVVMAYSPSSYPFGFQIKEGTQVDVHAAAPGKAILAFLPEVEAEEILNKSKFKRYNENTITTKRAMKVELNSIRETGYAVDNEEMVKGCHCISVPIFNESNYPIAAIWTTGPADRLLEEHYEDIATKLKECAAQIQRQLQVTG